MASTSSCRPPSGSELDLDFSRLLQHLKSTRSPNDSSILADDFKPIDLVISKDDGALFPPSIGASHSSSSYSSSSSPPIETPPDQPSTSSPPESPICWICLEIPDTKGAVEVADCKHSFCEGCLSTYVQGQLMERRYPIRCPACTGFERRGYVQVEPIMDSLRLSPMDVDRLRELQVAELAALVQCNRCKEEMYIDREQYESNDILSCPLPSCQYSWCKGCMKEVTSPCDSKHACAKNKKLHKLAKRKGWKECPGCGVLVDKLAGCNHMTCSVPRCSVHFCFRCGGMIYNPTIHDYVGEAITSHYRNCRQYERWYHPPRRVQEACSIQ